MKKHTTKKAKPQANQRKLVDELLNIATQDGIALGIESSYDSDALEDLLLDHFDTDAGFKPFRGLILPSKQQLKAKLLKTLTPELDGLADETADEIIAAFKTAKEQDQEEQDADRQEDEINEDGDICNGCDELMDECRCEDEEGCPGCAFLYDDCRCEDDD